MEKVIKSEKEWRNQLTSEEFYVCRQKGTERAFTGTYNQYKKPGTYVCTCCGQSLFDAIDKLLGVPVKGACATRSDPCHCPSELRSGTDLHQLRSRTVKSCGATESKYGGNPRDFSGSCTRDSVSAQLFAIPGKC